MSNRGLSNQMKLHRSTGEALCHAVLTDDLPGLAAAKFKLKG
jgi:hypothetical protein